MVSIKAKLSRHIMHDEQDGRRVEQRLLDSDRLVIDGADMMTNNAN